MWDGMVPGCRSRHRRQSGSHSPLVIGRCELPRGFCSHVDLARWNCHGGAESGCGLVVMVLVGCNSPMLLYEFCIQSFHKIIDNISCTFKFLGIQVVECACSGWLKDLAGYIKECKLK